MKKYIPRILAAIAALAVLGALAGLYIFRAVGIVNKGPARASFHSLRATFISLMDEAGIPPHVTDAITGHAGGGMHARYTQPSAETLQRAVLRAIPPLVVRNPLKQPIGASPDGQRA